MAINKASRRGSKMAAPKAEKTAADEALEAADKALQAEEDALQAGGDEAATPLSIKGEPEPVEEPDPMPAAEPEKTPGKVRERGATHVLQTPAIIGGKIRARGDRLKLGPDHAKALEAQGCARRL